MTLTTFLYNHYLDIETLAHFLYNVEHGEITNA